MNNRSRQTLHVDYKIEHCIIWSASRLSVIQEALLKRLVSWCIPCTIYYVSLLANHVVVLDRINIEIYKL